MGGRASPLRRRALLARRRGAVEEAGDAVGIGFGGEEPEPGGAVARLDEGDAFADEDGKRRREQ